ncbi:MAG: phosphatase PAP2 family protein [Dehalococcoidia bacterium]|nr:phosphatase PAP2 family protein [Dehalococcoidia bacterium]
MDAAFVLLLNGVAGKSWALDTAINLIVRSDVIRGGLIVAMFMAAWHRGSDRKTLEENRRRLITALVGTVVALVIAQLLEAVLPFKPRPINDPALGFAIPIGMTPDFFDEMSTFPSDHAALFFGLGAGIYLVSRRLGCLALAIAVVIVSLPRIYLGLHYPSDIAGGAALGIAAVGVANLVLLRSRLPALIGNWAQVQPSIFFALFFLVNLEMATTFEDTRNIGAFILHLMLR